ncbi:Gp19/Gp15/Gp42 family protein [Kitasatospora sp. NPDC087314]|uniref:Gp19/Gp15/Gp42 family protein n=1 Tax=Kitasatospora sp. NPDC087314 TaxID=3364068 RepID=UPI003825EC99
MTDLATLTDLADRLGRDLTPTESRQATALLHDATAVILDRFPRYATTPTAASTAVCSAMVLRVLRNPDGKRSEQIDDYSYTVDSARSAGELYITEHELDTLRPIRTSAFSITPVMPPVVTS